MPAAIKVVEKDGAITVLRFLNLRAARHAVYMLNEQSNVRCAFVLKENSNVDH